VNGERVPGCGQARTRAPADWARPLPGGATLVAGAVDQHAAVGLPDRAAAHTVLRRLTAALTARLTAALVKLSPVNAYLEPVLNRAFACFVERRFVRITAGGSEVGSYLVGHPAVDSVHITGSGASHDAVVFGPGEEGARRKDAREPLLGSRSPASSAATRRRRGPCWPTCTATTWTSPPSAPSTSVRPGRPSPSSRAPRRRSSCARPCASARGPFQPRPTPPWFVTNRTAHLTGEQMTRFAAEDSLGAALPRVLAAVASSLRGWQEWPAAPAPAGISDVQATEAF
jgi:hypothetical protein